MRAMLLSRWMTWLKNLYPKTEPCDAEEMNNLLTGDFNYELYLPPRKIPFRKFPFGLVCSACHKRRREMSVLIEFTTETGGGMMFCNRCWFQETIKIMAPAMKMPMTPETLFQHISEKDLSEEGTN